MVILISEYKLIEEILKVSKSKNWDTARLEWGLDSIDYSEDEFETCSCGHYPIKELCFLVNKINGNKIMVGNCCVNKFITSSDKLFKIREKVVQDISKSFNADYIDMMHNKKVITDWEYDFYLNIWRKRKLSEKQFSIKLKINKKILGHEGLLERAYKNLHKKVDEILENK